jgi:membrane fusion protein (multidrug efflux system)
MSTLVVLLAACSGAPAPPPAPVPPPARAPQPVAAVAEAGFIGVIVAGEWADLEPRVEGRIEQLYVGPGDAVTRGQPIARLDGLASKHELAGARAILREASHRLRRRRGLARTDAGAVTDEELDAARRDVLEARAHVAKLAQARDDARLLAPFDGTISETYLSAGATAGPGRAVAHLVGKSPPRVRFAVPPERIGSVRLGKMVAVEIAAPGPELRARVTGLNPEIDAASGLIHGSATLDDQGDGRLATGVIARVVPVVN